MCPEHVEAHRATKTSDPGLPKLHHDPDDHDAAAVRPCAAGRAIFGIHCHCEPGSLTRRIARLAAHRPSAATVKPTAFHTYLAKAKAYFQEQVVMLHPAS